ncbi:hypothetical protein IMCC26134_07595 [Verrucomicrobia bacterium IMCC26134]|jgi:hypothetical protein|nr:hypothetical protein IMCC26134_07595 [Verrucomicrobia bacterium IMCC26134]
MRIPIIPYLSFSSLVGDALAEDLDQLVAKKNSTEVVLFSDETGVRNALMPIGPGHQHTKLDELAGEEIEGLKPLCAIRLDPDGTKPDPTLEYERMLARLESKLKERETELDRREKTLIHLEKDFFERGGHSNVAS